MKYEFTDVGNGWLVEEFDDKGNRIKATDAEGRRYEYKYNKYNKVFKVVCNKKIIWEIDENLSVLLYELKELEILLDYDIPCKGCLDITIINPLTVYHFFLNKLSFKSDIKVCDEEGIKIFNLIYNYWLENIIEEE